MQPAYKIKHGRNSYTSAENDQPDELDHHKCS